MSEQPHKTLDPAHMQRHLATYESKHVRIRKKPGVLVIDDDHMVRIMVQSGLEQYGFDAWTAHHGREAIDIYCAHQQDIRVVLLDVGMPGYAGLQTWDSLRALTPEIPACFMCADVGASEPNELLMCGAAYVFAKPFYLKQVITVLRRLTTDAPAGQSGDECHLRMAGTGQCGGNE